MTDYGISADVTYRNRRYIRNPNGAECEQGGDAAFWDRFSAQLPIEFLVLGRTCLVNPFRKSWGEVEIFVDESIDVDVVTPAAREFEGRKWMGVYVAGCPVSLSELDIPVTSRNAIGDFLEFFLGQPIGPRLLTVGQSQLNSFHDRRNAIDQAYLTWFALNYAARRGDGKLKHAIPCCGYFRDNRGLCRRNVLDLSGVCPSHRSRSSKTLFNFYPWFEREGFPDARRLIPTDGPVG